MGAWKHPVTRWVSEQLGAVHRAAGNRARRDGAQRFLRERGIPSMIYYPRCIHQQTAYADRRFDDAFYPNALAACDRVLSLPMHPYLTEADIGRVAEAVREYCRTGCA